MRISRLLTTAALAALAAGCGSNTGGSAQPGSSPPSPTSSSASTVSVKNSDFGGKCPPLGWSSDNGTRIALSDIDTLVVCPQIVPGGNRRVIRLTRGQPEFTALLDQLGRPSVHARPGQICPMYATVTQYVLASAGGSWYVVDLPTDGCGHYLMGLMGLLNRLRS